VDLKALGVDLKTEDAEEGKLVCQCFSLSEPFIRRKIKEMGLKTIPEIIEAIKAGGACMSCHHVPGGLQDLLDEAWGATGARSSAENEKPADAQEEPVLSPYQFNKKVDKTIEQYIRPMLQKDGGDLEVVDIKDKLVYCRLQGACSSCQGAAQTLKLMVERVLKDNVDERIRVIQV
jgi:NifU-like protein